MSLFKLLKQVLAAGFPAEDYPPSNIAAMIKTCKSKGRDDLAEQILNQWAKVLEKYPNTRVNWAAASCIGNSSVKKHVFGGKDFAEWINEQLETPVPKAEVKETKEIIEIKDVPAIAIPKKDETVEDWVAASERTKEMLQNAQRAFKTTEEFIDYLNKEIEDLKRKLAEYGPGGAKEKTKRGELTEMAKRVPKWENQLASYVAKYTEIHENVISSKEKFVKATDTYNNTRVTTVAFEKKTQNTLEDVLEFILNVEDLQKQRVMLEKFQQTLQKMEKEKVAASVVVANVFSDIFGAIKQLWNNLVKWSKNLGNAVSKFEESLNVGMPVTAKTIKIKLNNAVATVRVIGKEDGTFTAKDVKTNAIFKKITAGSSFANVYKVNKEKFEKLKEAYPHVSWHKQGSSLLLGYTKDMHHLFTYNLNDNTLMTDLLFTSTFGKSISGTTVEEEEKLQQFNEQHNWAIIYLKHNAKIPNEEELAKQLGKQVEISKGSESASIHTYVSIQTNNPKIIKDAIKLIGKENINWTMTKVAISKVLASAELLSTKLIQIGGLYNIGLAIKGETKPSSPNRLVEYIKMKHGQGTVDSLITKPHANLRAELSKYDIIEIPKAAASTYDLSFRLEDAKKEKNMTPKSAGNVAFDFDNYPEGGRFTLFKEKTHTDEDITKAEKWLKNSQDVLSIKTVNIN